VSGTAAKRTGPRAPRAAAGPGNVAFTSDAALVEGLRAEQPAAIAVFYDRYAAHVNRLLGRVLGVDGELADVHHDVFVRALGSLRTLRDPGALGAWITSVTLFTARTAIQRRARRRWLSFLAPEALPEVEAPPVSGEHGEALRATYAVLDRLPTEERIAFVLRFLEGMEHAEIASATEVSVATIKRRLTRAEERFTRAARKHPALREWLEGGTRWGTKSDL
jgi:RNA polymerase sigma-70 factor, ECF subfamily